MTIETLFNEAEAKQAAIKKILIDGSNQKDVIKEIGGMLNEKSLGKARVIVAEVLDEKRIARAIEWFKANDFDYQEALFRLPPEFAAPGTQPNRKVAEIVLDEAFRRCGKEAPVILIRAVS